MNRYYAFDKKTGDLIWSATPGERPKDSCFSTPTLGWYKNQRVFWCGGGEGDVYCVNARTGDAVWRFQIGRGGVNPSLLLYNDMVVAIHGTENVDSSTIGGMVAIKPPDVLPAPAEPGSPPN